MPCGVGKGLQVVEVVVKPIALLAPFSCAGIKIQTHVDIKTVGLRMPNAKTGSLSITADQVPKLDSARMRIIVHTRPLPDKCKHACEAGKVLEWL